jgi:Family of unknown function (DUF5947)
MLPAARQAGLRRFVSSRGPELPFRLEPRPRDGERCEMCGEPIDDEHPHVVNLDSRRLLCTCKPCSLLFTRSGAGRGNFRAIPDRYLSSAGGALSDAEWEQLQVPVALAFFFHNSVLGRVVAQYPSPAGATESLLDLTAWELIADHNPLAAQLEPDVEALIVRRTDGGGEAFLVPIDACYELVGRLRMHWTGFDGGPDARRDIDEFFARARARSRPVDGGGG